MSTDADFRIAHLRPADSASLLAEGTVWKADLTVLVQHHTVGATPTSYLLSYDASAVWGLPGSEPLVSIEITRDLSQGTYTFASATHAGFAFAQRWLVERGCPPEHIATLGEEFIQPADDRTRAVEQQVRTSAGRYEVLDSWAEDGAVDIWTLVRDTQATEAPIRVFLEQTDLDASTYTVREGAFPDEDAARQWLQDPSTPLPQPPEDRLGTDTPRTRVALARSTGAPRTTVCGLDTLPTTTTSAVQQPGPGRSR